MAKVKIIKAEDLKMLKCAIIEESDRAQLEAKVYADRACQQQSTKQNQEILDDARQSQKTWLDRGRVLHECLVKIENYSSEIEI